MWAGRSESSGCSGDGVFDGICGEIPRQNVSIVVSLIQTGTAVTGTIDAGGIAVKVTGTAQGNRLVITGRDRFTSAIDMAYEDWQSTIGASGTTMDGTFTLRFFPAQNGVRGGASWKQTLVNVMKR